MGLKSASRFAHCSLNIYSVSGTELVTVWKIWLVIGFLVSRNSF